MGACVRNAVRPTIQASTRNVRRALRSRSGWMQCFHRGKGGEYKNAESTSRLLHSLYHRINRSLLRHQVAINRGLLLGINRCHQPQQLRRTILRHQQQAFPNDCYSGCTERLLQNMQRTILRYQQQQHRTLAVGRYRFALL